MADLKSEEERKRLMKEAFKETVREWMDEQFSIFGKWTLRGLAALGFGALVYLIGWSSGWGPPAGHL